MPNQADQAIGFLLEFENKASDDLKQANADFNSAVDSLEKAVEAAQAAFTFLEEGSGNLARTMAGAVKDVVAKTDELKGAITDVGKVEVTPPDLGPVREALSKFGDEIEKPPDLGLSQVPDDIKEMDLQAPTLADYEAFVEKIEKPIEIPPPEMDSFDVALKHIDVLAKSTASSMESPVSAFDAALVRAGKSLKGEILTGLKDVGAAGKEAAEAIATDTVQAFERLRKKAVQFTADNADALKDAKNTGEVWLDFWEQNLDDVQKFQSVLKASWKTDFKPLVKNLSDQFGKSAFPNEFWGAIVEKRVVDQEFLDKVRDQIKKDRETPKTWWQSLLGVAKKVFWPGFAKQGKDTAGDKHGFVHTLAEHLKEAFKEPIVQFAAALQFSRLIDRVFGPIIDEFTELVGMLLLPWIRALLEIFEEIKPAILEANKALLPLIRAFVEIGTKLAQSLIPALELTAKTIGFLVTPIAKAIRWLSEMKGIGIVLGTTLAVFLIPILTSYAVTVGGLLVSAISKNVAVTTVYNALTWKSVKAHGDLAHVFLTKTIPHYWGLFTARVSSISSIITETIAIEGGLIPAIVLAVREGWAWLGQLLTQAAAFFGLGVATEGATVAMWGFNIALDANPIGLIILAVAALIGLLWLLWDPIKSVFGWLWDAISPVTDALGNLWEATKEFLGAIWDLGKSVLGVFFENVLTGFRALGTVLGWVLAPIKWVNDGIQKLFELLGGSGSWLSAFGSFIMNVVTGPLKIMAAMIDGLAEGLRTLGGWIKTFTFGIVDPNKEKGPTNAVKSEQENARHQGAGDKPFSIMGGSSIRNFINANDPEVKARQERQIAIMEEWSGTPIPRPVPSPDLRIGAQKNPYAMSPAKYDHAGELKAGDISNPIVKAIEKLAGIVEKSMGGNSSSEDLDVSDLADIASLD